MTDRWTTIAGLATGVGTLVLAMATFASVKSANRAARAAERSLLAGIRPLLVPTKAQDPPEKVGFHDDHWMLIEGGRAAAEVSPDAIYLAVPLRNVGSGLAVMDRWCIHPEREATPGEYLDPASYRRLTRDLYVAPGENGFWQGAIRDRDDPQWDAVRRAITERHAMVVDLLYADLEGGQRTISRFSIIPFRDADWMSTVGRHWFIDQPDPR